jgi:ribosomal protein L37E
MASCEKCWRDARLRADSAQTEHAEEYRKLVAERDRAGETCSPQEQAGPSATDCGDCGQRGTVHQHAKICMACGVDFLRDREGEHR